MTTPLSPAAVALAKKNTRRAPSDSPAAARWLANPSAKWVQLDHREQAFEQLLHFLYRSLPPSFVERLKAESAGLLPSQALKLFGDHFDDPLPPPHNE